MNLEIIPGSMKSTFIREDYFPAIISYGFSTEYCKHIVFEKDDTDALELCVDSESEMLLKIVLILCTHLSESPENIQLHNAEEAVLHLTSQTIINCTTFTMHLYSDGFYIRLSEITPARYIQCGQTQFGLSSENEIVDFCAFGLTNDDITHIKNELSETECTK